MFIGEEVANHFTNKNLKNIFKKCGYLAPGRFDSSEPFNADFNAMGFSRNIFKRNEKESCHVIYMIYI